VRPSAPAPVPPPTAPGLLMLEWHACRAAGRWLPRRQWGPAGGIQHRLQAVHTVRARPAIHVALEARVTVIHWQPAHLATQGLWLAHICSIWGHKGTHPLWMLLRKQTKRVLRAQRCQTPSEGGRKEEIQILRRYVHRSVCTQDVPGDGMLRVMSCGATQCRVHFFVLRTHVVGSWAGPALAGSLQHGKEASGAAWRAWRSAGACTCLRCMAWAWCLGLACHDCLLTCMICGAGIWHRFVLPLLRLLILRQKIVHCVCVHTSPNGMQGGQAELLLMRPDHRRQTCSPLVPPKAGRHAAQGCSVRQSLLGWLCPCCACCWQQTDRPPVMQLAVRKASPSQPVSAAGMALLGMQRRIDPAAQARPSQHAYNYSIANACHTNKSAHRLLQLQRKPSSRRPAIARCHQVKHSAPA
jgi:hypothetical protein